MKDFFRFLLSKDFLKQLFYVGLFFAAILACSLLWLKSYTNHGQKITMPDYTNMSMTEAKQDAKEKTFTIIVSDSVHIVGRPGGIIRDQNPVSGAKVKENRKIYVTTTKYSPDHILVKDLPLLYGTDYNQAISDLKSRSLFSEIKSKKYDAGQPNHILEVWYDNQLIIDKTQLQSTNKIEKGGTLQFVVSEKKGGLFEIPTLECKSLADAKSYMLYSKMKIGQIKIQGDITEDSKMWIISQSPKNDDTRKIEAGTTIDIIVSSEKPQGCI